MIATLIIFFTIFLFVSPLFHEYSHYLLLNFMKKDYRKRIDVSLLSGVSGEIVLFSPTSLPESALLLSSGFLSSLLLSSIFYFLFGKVKKFNEIFLAISLSFLLDSIVNSLSGDALILGHFAEEYSIPFWLLPATIFSMEILLGVKIVKNLHKYLMHFYDTQVPKNGIN